MQVLSWIGRRLGGGWRSKAEKPIEQNIGPPVTFNENIARKSWNNSEYIEIPKPLRPLFLYPSFFYSHFIELCLVSKLDPWKSLRWLPKTIFGTRIMCLTVCTTIFCFVYTIFCFVYTILLCVHYFAACTQFFGTCVLCPAMYCHDRFEFITADGVCKHSPKQRFVSPIC